MMNHSLSSLIFATGLFFTSVGWSLNADSTQLFDFSKSLFPNGADQTRLELEKEFIEYGKKTELTPKNYVRHLLSWFKSEGEGYDLGTYRYSYLNNSNRYYYENFADTSQEIWGQKSYIQKGYLFFHISRDAKNIERLWNIFDDLVLEIIAPYMEDGRREKLYVQILMEAWDCISEKKNYEKKLDEIYGDLVEYGYYSVDDYSKTIACPSVNNRLITPTDEYLQYEKGWIYSFWVRRHHEGNAEVTYKILQRLLE